MGLKDRIRADNTYRNESELSVNVEGIAVDHLPAVSSRKYIKLTPSFDERSKVDQNVYLWSLCSSMNEALDVMQRERNHVLKKLLPAKEALVMQLQQQNIELSQALSLHMQRLNAAANDRAAELHAVKQAHAQEIAALKKG